MPEDVLVVGAAIAAFAVALPFLWKYFQPTPGEVNLFDAAKALGFELSKDGRAWLRSQLPRLHVSTVVRYSHSTRGRRRREEGADQTALWIAKKEDVDFTTVLFYRDEFVNLEGPIDFLVIALNPKDAAVLPPLGDAVRERVRQETGWLVQTHGGWLVLVRDRQHAIEPDALSALLDDARHAYESATRPQPLS